MDTTISAIDTIELPERANDQETVYIRIYKASEVSVDGGAITIDQAYEVEDGTTVTIVGQIQYRYGKNGSVNKTILEGVIDGEVYGFQVYNALSGCELGDVVAITGNVNSYGKEKQLQKPTDGNITVTKLKEADLIGPQTVTISELIEKKDAYLSEYVKIENVTLGTYSTSNTPITDSEGNSLNIYQSSSYPDGLAEKSLANVYGVYSKYNATYQLRNGSSQDSFKKAGYEVDSSIETTLAKWVGTGKIEGTICYGDLYSDNDFLDQSAQIQLSTGIAPQYSNTVNGATEYYIGSLGLSMGEYYQMEFSSDKYASMGLSFKMRSSNSGAKYYNVLYSTDGVTFEQSNQSKLEATASWQTYNVAFTDEIANAERVYIRLQVAEENGRIDGKTTAISNSYTCRLTNITVTGSPIISDEICGLVHATPAAGAVAIGSAVTITCDTSAATIYYSMNDSEYKEYDEANKPVFTELPTVLTTYAKRDGKEDSVKITYVYTQAQVSTVKGSPNGGSVKRNSEVKLSCETSGATIYYSLDDGKTYETYNVYFGQIHSHTNYSDGVGTASDAFVYASTKVDDLDFLAVTDHSNYFDNDNSCTITDGFLSRNDTGYGNGSNTSLVNYYTALKTVPDSISQFNHPGTTFGDFYDFAYYDTEIDPLITTIEVGNGEGAVGSTGYFPSYEYYTRALNKG